MSASPCHCSLPGDFAPAAACDAGEARLGPGTSPEAAAHGEAQPATECGPGAAEALPEAAGRASAVEIVAEGCRARWDPVASEVALALHCGFFASECSGVPAFPLALSEREPVAGGGRGGTRRLLAV